MEISDVVKKSGVPASTLRYYEEKGLITPVGRRGIRRVYAPDILQRLALIALGRATGFSLDEIAQMFGVDGKPRIEPKVLLAKAEQLDRQIQRLTAMRNGLKHAANCSAPSHMECPKFQRIVRIAGAARMPPLNIDRF